MQHRVLSRQVGFAIPKNGDITGCTPIMASQVFIGLQGWSYVGGAGEFAIKEAEPLLVLLFINWILLVSLSGMVETPRLQAKLNWAI
jgi:hypothetical protein